MKAVTPLSFSQRNRRRNSARTMRMVRQAGEQHLDGIQHHAFGADRIDGFAQPDEQAARDRIRRSPRFRSVRCAPSPRQLLARQSVGADRYPSEATFVASSSAVSSKAMKTPGSLYSVAPCARNAMPSMVLPQPAAPHTKVGRPLGRPPPVISSRPEMPVGTFSSPLSDVLVFAPRIFIKAPMPPASPCYFRLLYTLIRCAVDLQ